MIANKQTLTLLAILLLAPAIASAAAPKLKLPPLSQDKADTFVVMSFNILQGGGHAPKVGFPNGAFDGSRKDDIARVITACRADVVGVQEDDGSDGLLKELGRDWHRAGNVYAKHPLTQIAGGVRVHLPNDRLFVIVNTHWWPTGGYGPSVVQKRLEKGDVPQDLDKFETQILKATSGIARGPRGYLNLINRVKPLIEAGEVVVVTGDFNEPSHQDWTQAAAERGMDRWVKNTSGRPLRFKVAWAGSVALEKAGLSDAYRTRFPDEIKKPGNTWTPPYPDGLPGRQPYHHQVLDRIDRIHFTGVHLRVLDAAVVGEDKRICEIAHSGPWVSDHRAVVATFEFTGGAKKLSNPKNDRNKSKGTKY